MERHDTILSASLLCRWLASGTIEGCPTFVIRNNLFVAEPGNLVQNFRSISENEAFYSAVRDLICKSPDTVLAILSRSEQLNTWAKDLLSQPEMFQGTLDDALDAFCRVTMYGTTIANTISKIAQTTQIPDQVKDAALRLRGESYYPRLTRDIIVPLCIRYLGEHGVVIQPDVVELLTLSEILDRRVSATAERATAQRNGWLFVYSNIKGVEQVDWVDDAATILSSLGVPEKTTKSGALQGTVVGRWPIQKVRGRAKVVLSYDPRGVEVQADEVLVSHNAHPDLTPLIMTCRAMVTNEGGENCHAATTIRQFHKPCILGTAAATHVIRNGDLVELDLQSGTVRIVLEP